MFPAFSSPINRPLRRITFICCACIMLFAACFDLPDQDAVVKIDALKNDETIFKIDTTAAYDTILSSIRCNVIYRNGGVATDWPVLFVADSNKIEKTTGSAGITDMVWTKKGIYAMRVGDPSEFPCVIVNNIPIPGGRRCEITIKLPIDK